MEWALIRPIPTVVPRIVTDKVQTFATRLQCVNEDLNLGLIPWVGSMGKISTTKCVEFILPIDPTRIAWEDAEIPVDTCNFRVILWGYSIFS